MSAPADSDFLLNPVDVASVVDSSSTISTIIGVVTTDDDDDAASKVESLAIDSASFANSVDVAPIDIEKAKVQALSQQLSRSYKENQSLKILLEKAQADFRRQIQQTHHLQKMQSKILRDAANPVSDPCDEVEKLNAELACTQKELAEEIEMSKKREARMMRLQEQLDSLKKQGEEQTTSIENQSALLIKNLKSQRNELLVVLRKQTKLIDILKQQRSHVEAAALLGMVEKDFMKVVGRH
ncbi:hypothetical protein ACHAXA_009402 [Cyclostephanos tholiformis]|uniref:Uncharacterized protein n=1 Tax=Cyclostephanos tholiformis TaxID=382380 RepID=A0ABD3RA61_9STRA